MKKIKLVMNIIINDKDQILLIYKSTSQYFYPISGKLEENESWINGAKREIFEETNLKPVNTKFITKMKQVFENIKEIETQIFFTSWFTGEVNFDYREGNLVWCNIDDIENIKLLKGDFIVIRDFLVDNLEDEYIFKYDKNRELICD